MKNCHLFILSLGPITIFWVVGNASGNSVLITDYLTTNQHNGDRLRRVFPLSPFDYSIELTINRDTHERSYSCVIDGATDAETTLFTYIVRSISKLTFLLFDLFFIYINIESENTLDKVIKPHRNETVTIHESEMEILSNTTETMVAHDALTSEQVDKLRNKNSQEHRNRTTFYFI